MSRSALPLTISASVIAEHLNCPICLDLIKDAVIAPCGHHFCNRCLHECLNAQHKCPCCNAPTTAEQCHKDHQFNQLIITFIGEREASEKSYFERLIAEHADGIRAERHTALSPIEVLFRNYLKDSLAANESVYQTMRAAHATSRQKLEGIDTPEAKAGIIALDSQFEKSTMALVQSYETFLKALPVPSLLPVQITLSIPRRAYIKKGVLITPLTTGKDVKQLLLLTLKSDGVKVVQLKDDTHFIIRPPSGLTVIDRDAVVHDGDTPVIEHKILPDSIFELVGDIIHEDDLPKQCFADTFTPTVITPIDYFTCSTCSLNWLCRSCVDRCHIGHQIVLFTKAHVPKWGCCYCAKSKKCTLKKPQ